MAIGSKILGGGYHACQNSYQLFTYPKNRRSSGERLGRPVLSALTIPQPALLSPRSCPSGSSLSHRSSQRLSPVLQSASTTRPATPISPPSTAEAAPSPAVTSPLCLEAKQTQQQLPKLIGYQGASGAFAVPAYLSQETRNVLKKCTTLPPSV